jgi:hypothetical protein
MSTTVLSHGFIAVLAFAIHKDQRDDLEQQLYEAKTGLRLNADGTIIWYDTNAGKKYSECEFNGDLLIVGCDAKDQAARTSFMEAVLKVGLPVQEHTIQPYTCIWYNGCDCPLWDLTEEEFREGKYSQG